MGVEFQYPTAASPTTSWAPTKQPVYPAIEPENYEEQIVGESAGGTVYVQDKGPKRTRFTLEFDRITQTDRDNAQTFFAAVKQAANTFEFKDRDGTNHTVRWMNGFDFRLVANGRYSGTIELRKE